MTVWVNARVLLESALDSAVEPPPLVVPYASSVATSMKPAVCEWSPLARRSACDQDDVGVEGCLQIGRMIFAVCWALRTSVL